MRTVFAAALLLGPASLAAANQPIPDIVFTVNSVSITGDDCTLSVKNAGVTYWTIGWASE
jgi:hypothetical protein